jgi:hypothetical protein
MVVIINGMPRSGKDTFVELCQEINGNHRVYQYSTVDFVKDIAKLCGWNGTKTPKDRKFLSDLKDILTQWGDVPFSKTMLRIFEIYNEANIHFGLTQEQVLIFIHCREPQEIARFKKALGEQCRSLLIRRPTVETNDQSNHADEEVFNYEYDNVIYNDGTIADFRTKAWDFLHSLE